MKPEDIEAVKVKWGIDDSSICTIHDISAVCNPRQGGKTHAIEEKRAGKKTAIWLDKVMADWVNLQELLDNHQPMPHRIDGCYIDEDKVYLLEFKADGDINGLQDNLWTKYHDSYTILADRNLISLSEAKNHLYYIVVSGTRLQWSKNDIDETLLKRMAEKDKVKLLLDITSPMSDLLQRPWHFKELLPKANLRKLVSYSGKAAWTLDACQFDRFVEEYGWV